MATDSQTWRVKLTLDRPLTDGEAERILLRIMDVQPYAILSWGVNELAAVVVAATAADAGTAVGDAIRAEFKTDVAGIGAMQVGLADVDLS